MSWNEFAGACLDVQSALQKEHRIPSEVWVGSRAILPKNYLATLGSVVEELIESGKVSDSISFKVGNFTADQYVAEDSPEIWKWVIFPQGFHSPKIMQLAKQQAWTLKPAILRPKAQ